MVGTITKRKSIEAEVFPAEIERNWITPLKQYIANGLFPDDSNAAQKYETMLPVM